MTKTAGRYFMHVPLYVEKRQVASQSRVIIMNNDIEAALVQLEALAEAKPCEDCAEKAQRIEGDSGGHLVALDPGSNPFMTYYSPTTMTTENNSLKGGGFIQRHKLFLSEPETDLQVLAVLDVENVVCAYRDSVAALRRFYAAKGDAKLLRRTKRFQKSLAQHISKLNNVDDIGPRPTTGFGRGALSVSPMQSSSPATKRKDAPTPMKPRTKVPCLGKVLVIRDTASESSVDSTHVLLDAESKRRSISSIADLRDNGGNQEKTEVAGLFLQDILFGVQKNIVAGKVAVSARIQQQHTVALLATRCCILLDDTFPPEYEGALSRSNYASLVKEFKDYVLKSGKVSKHFRTEVKKMIAAKDGHKEFYGSLPTAEQEEKDPLDVARGTFLNELFANSSSLLPDKSSEADYTIQHVATHALVGRRQPHPDSGSELLAFQRRFPIQISLVYINERKDLLLNALLHHAYAPGKPYTQMEYATEDNYKAINDLRAGPFWLYRRRNVSRYMLHLDRSVYARTDDLVDDLYISFESSNLLAYAVSAPPSNHTEARRGVVKRAQCGMVAHIPMSRDNRLRSAVPLLTTSPERTRKPWSPRISPSTFTRHHPSTKLKVLNASTNRATGGTVMPYLEFQLVKPTAKSGADNESSGELHIDADGQILDFWPQGATRLGYLSDNEMRVLYPQE
ncbi:hypothetical protein BC832DRAFT_623308 [Gaertneriomyces semiglobifer]|nr:hypothetical protein BC832DRAFT_623308 [Gaertneriomyces semiglobifer]